MSKLTPSNMSNEDLQRAANTRGDAISAEQKEAARQELAQRAAEQANQG